MADLKREHKILGEATVKEALRLGILRGILELVMAALPFYRDLKPKDAASLVDRIIALVDRNALDFLAPYQMLLTGDVQREVADGIQRVVFSGIALGKSTEDMVRELGHVIKDPESFRHAGGRVFSKAQYLLEMILRTETLRAHNQGRITFYGRAGVEKLEWMTMEDKRVCPVCGPLDGKVYEIGKLPPRPRHPMCRCSALPIIPDPEKLKDPNVFLRPDEPKK